MTDLGTDLPQAPEHVEVIAFDAGGTLIDLDVPRIAERLRQEGISLVTEELQEAVYRAKPKDAKNRPGPHAEGETALRRYLGIVGGELEALQEQRGSVDPHWRSREWIEPLLQWLRTPEVSLSIWSVVPQGLVESLELLQQRYRLIVISNSDGHVAQRLDDVGLATHFEQIYDSGLLGFAKPDPRIFQRALDDLNLPPDRMVYVGDFYDIDIVGAAGAGVHGVLLDPVGAWSEIDCAKAKNMKEFAQRF